MSRWVWRGIAAASWLIGAWTLERVGRGLAGLYLYATGASLATIRADAAFFGAISYALPVLLILAAHEGGHWLMAHRAGLASVGPFLLPMPLSWSPPFVHAIGTMGAVLWLPPHRQLTDVERFDIAWAGLMSGYAVTLVWTLVGWSWSVPAVVGHQISAQWTPGPLSAVLTSPTAWHPLLSAARIGWWITLIGIVTDGWWIFPAISSVWRVRRWQVAALCGACCSCVL